MLASYYTDSEYLQSHSAVCFGVLANFTKDSLHRNKLLGEWLRSIFKKFGDQTLGKTRVIQHKLRYAKLESWLR